MTIDELRVELRFDMDIDPDQLDVEWLEQATKMMDWAERSAKAAKALSLAEEKVKTTRSNLSLKANRDPDATLGKGIKPTDTKIEAWYRTQPEHIAVKEALIEAQAIASYLMNAVFAFAQRKAALENLVSLLGREYFSAPNVPRDLTSALRERRRSADETRTEAAGKTRRRRRSS